MDCDEAVWFSGNTCFAELRLIMLLVYVIVIFML